MSFFFAPFIFLLELLGFLLSVAVMYGLALIAAVTVIGYAIADIKANKPIIETVTEVVTVVERHEVTKFVEKGPELICERIAGCEVFPNAKTDEEYCPTCVVK